MVQKNEYGERFEVKNGVERTYKMPSTTFGLYPFVSTSNTLSVFGMNNKNGYSRQQNFIKETGVQFDYHVSKLRKYDMSNPEDHKEYWSNRAKVKALYHRLMVERNKRG
jgi:hypothetical protein